MLLGLSSDTTDGIDPALLSEGAGVVHGADLFGLVQALSRQIDVERASARVDEVIGRPARTDAVAVYANFSMMTRIADATGTPLDRGTDEISASLRSQLGVNEWISRRH